jgi:hypothetical protein
MVGVVDDSGLGPAVPHSHVQGSEDQLRLGAGPMAQPTTRRERTSSTAEKYSQPSPVMCWVKSATRSWSGPTVKSRRTRSGCGSWRSLGLVKPRRLRRCAPTRPARMAANPGRGLPAGSGGESAGTGGRAEHGPGTSRRLSRWE